MMGFIGVTGTSSQALVYKRVCVGYNFRVRDSMLIAKLSLCG